MLIYIPLGLTAGLLLNLLIMFSGLTELFPYYTENAAPALFSVGAPAAALLYLVLAPVLEETVFRLILFGLLRRKLSLMPSALISAALFGIYHGNAVQFLYAFLMGVLFAIAYEKDHRPPVPILLHASANASVLYLLPLIPLR